MISPHKGAPTNAVCPTPLRGANKTASLKAWDDALDAVMVLGERNHGKGKERLIHSVEMATVLNGIDRDGNAGRIERRTLTARPVVPAAHHYQDGHAERGHERTQNSSEQVPVEAIEAPI